MFARHFAAGGDLPSLDTEKVRARFEAEVERGRQVVAGLREEATAVSGKLARWRRRQPITDGAAEPGAAAGNP